MPCAHATRATARYGARRMAESAALLVDEVFSEQPIRQWVLSVPYPLRFLFASRPAIMGRVLGIVYRCIATHLIKKVGSSLHLGVAARARDRAGLEPARGVRPSLENVPLIPKPKRSVASGAWTKMIRFESKIRFPTHSETISLDCAPAEKCRYLYAGRFLAPPQAGLFD